MDRSLLHFPLLLTAGTRGARVIGTDAPRIALVVRESSDGKEHQQESEDNPNVNAHQSSPVMG